MNGEAKELRELARKIERVTAESRISSVAMPAVQALLDYLTLRARIMELEGQLDERRESKVEEGYGDAPDR
jgi:hypothetical protein